MVVIGGIGEVAQHLIQPDIYRRTVENVIVLELCLVRISNLDAELEGSIVLVDAVAPPQRSRTLKVKLRASIVGNRVRREQILRRVVDVGSVENRKFRLVELARIQTKIDAGLAAGSAVEFRCGEILPANIVGPRN